MNDSKKNASTPVRSKNSIDIVFYFFKEKKQTKILASPY